MKKKSLTQVLAVASAFILLAGCGSTKSADVTTESSTESSNQEVSTEVSESADGSEMTDEERAKEVADLIDAIYVQEWTDETDELCKKAKEAWDALTDEQKELVVLFRSLNYFLPFIVNSHFDITKA